MLTSSVMVMVGKLKKVYDNGDGGLFDESLKDLHNHPEENSFSFISNFSINSVSLSPKIP